MSNLPELRRKILAQDLEARCVIGGPVVEAELLALVDANLERREHAKELEALFAGVTDGVLGAVRRRRNKKLKDLFADSILGPFMAFFLDE